MRKITRDAVDAFFGWKSFSRGNTTVTHFGNESELRLHGNMIAEKHHDKLMVSHCGWCTPTTRERLNGVVSSWNADLGVRIRGGVMQVVDQDGEVTMEISGSMERLVG